MQMSKTKAIGNMTPTIFKTSPKPKFRVGVENEASVGVLEGDKKEVARMTLTIGRGDMLPTDAKGGR